MDYRFEMYEHASHERWKEQYKRQLSWPLCWYGSAISLRRAADILWEEVQNDWKETRFGGDEAKPSVAQNCLMLLGLAVENLVKGICVSKGDVFNQKGKFKYNDHSLSKLCRDNHIDIDEKDWPLLLILEQFVVWAGKFPGPLRYEDLVPVHLPDGSIGILNMVSQGYIIRSFEIVDRLAEYLWIGIENSNL